MFLLRCPAPSTHIRYPSWVMWASGDASITALDPASSITNKNSSSKKLLPASYTSKSSASSLVPQLPTQTRKTMEDVWKDISLSSLHDTPNRSETLAVDIDHVPKSRAIIGLQDFLARPFNHQHSIDSITIPDPLVFASPSTPPSRPQVPVPTTVLSLNSSSPPEFPSLGALPPFHTSPSSIKNSNSDYHYCFPTAASISPSFMADTPRTSVFDAFGSSPPALPSLCNKKRLVPESQENSGDRRHKRMIKNRESAARSRARKQACS